MTLRFCYTRPDGGVSIVHAAPKADLERVLGPLTDAAYRAHVIERSIPPDATDVQEMPADWTPPADRSFRNAWKQTAGTIDVDMVKARAIQAERIQREKAARLAALAKEYTEADMLADVPGKQRISGQAQALRALDVAAAVNAAKDPAELKAAWPF